MKRDRAGIGQGTGEKGGKGQRGERKRANRGKKKGKAKNAITFLGHLLLFESRKHAAQRGRKAVGAYNCGTEVTPCSLSNNLKLKRLF